MCLNRLVSNKFVARLGTYLGLDLEYFVKNYLCLIVAQGISMILGLALSVAFARLLTKELYGQWNYILSIIGIVGLLTLPGMNQAIIQSVARGGDGVLVKGTQERFKWSILASIAVLGTGVYYFLSGSALLGQGLMISSLFLPFYHNFQTYAAFLSGRKRFDKVAKYQIIIEITSILLTVFAIYLSRNLTLILVVYLFSFSVLRGYFFRLTAKDTGKEGCDKGALTFGKHVTIQNIPGAITGWGDKIIIGALLSFPELAIYSIARSVANSIRLALSPIARLSFPKLSEMDEKGAYSAVRKRFAYLLIFTVFICGITIVLCPYVIPFLYSQKYAASVFYAQILLVALVFGIPTSILSQALFPSQRKVGDMYKLQLFGVISQVIFIFALIFKFGLLGVVIARVLANLFAMVYSWKLAKWI